MPMQLEIITAERVVLTDEVDQVNAPTRAGRVGILPHHAPLLTVLDFGELDIYKNGEVTPFAVTGGFMEVLNNRVTILADTAERSDEIDLARAEAARKRAEERMQAAASQQDLIRAEAELRRAMIRLRVAETGRVRRIRD
jgi:F-type H+-transporting ATPase subunit epsilon